jgi:hypothetical protein
MGFVYWNVPHCRHVVCALSPRHRCRCRSARPLPSNRTRSALVGSHHLDGFSHRDFGFVAPRSRPGFVTFRDDRPIQHLTEAKHRRGVAAPFPATRFTPLEEYPSSVAVPHHCGRCLLAVRSFAATVTAEAFTEPCARSDKPPRRCRDIRRSRCPSWYAPSEIESSFHLAEARCASAADLPGRSQECAHSRDRTPHHPKMPGKPGPPHAAAVVAPESLDLAGHRVPKHPIPTPCCVFCRKPSIPTEAEPTCLPQPLRRAPRDRSHPSAVQRPAKSVFTPTLPCV